MPSKPFSPEQVEDFLLDFAAGVNMGSDPFLLPKNQLADALNLTVRGDFATPRPAYRKIALDFGGNAALQTAFDLGLWQGACYFKPDFAAESLMAAMAGKLWQFVIGATSALVSDATIPGDANPSTIPQAWLWQSEKWIIWQDGNSVPIFYDGVAARRSRGPGVHISDVNGAVPTVAVGKSVAIVLDDSYVGPFNVPIFIGSALYQVTGTGTAHAGFALTVANNSDTPGATVPTGASVLSNTSKKGYLATAIGRGDMGASYLPPGFEIITLNLVSPYGGAVGDILPITGNSGYTNGPTIRWRVTGVSGNQVTITNMDQIGSSDGSVDPSTVHNGYFYPAGTNVHLSSAGTTTNLGTVIATDPAVPATGFIVPGVGTQVLIWLSQNYTGPLNAVITIGGKGYVVIAYAPQSAPSTTINAINLTDTFPGTIADDASVDTVPEIGPGKMGTYGMGRNWYSLPDGRTFRATDIVGGGAGTKGEAFRDSVLKETENGFLLGGGNFVVPGNIGEIRAMRFTSILDKSLGTGPLQVLTPSVVFSCNATVDRLTWAALTNPILTESLIAYGGLGQESTQIANGDMLFRSSDGLRSLILGQRQFSGHGNTPISFEVQPILSADTNGLLNFSSAVVFDNRWVMTTTPKQGQRGVYHPGLIALNFDPVSTLRGKAEEVYDGAWNGLNVLQLLKGEFSGTERCFAFCLSTDLSKIELWELLASNDPIFNDDSVNRIQWLAASGVLSFGENDPRLRQLKRLTDGEIYVDELVGPVDFKVFYKPDQWPDWQLWYSWSEAGGTAVRPQFRPRMGLGEPDASPFDPDTDRPLREGYVFQVKIVITGQCRFLGARFRAVTQPQPQFAPPKST